MAEMFALAILTTLVKEKRRWEENLKDTKGTPSKQTPYNIETLFSACFSEPATPSNALLWAYRVMVTWFEQHREVLIPLFTLRWRTKSQIHDNHKRSGVQLHSTRKFLAVASTPKKGHTFCHYPDAIAGQSLKSEVSTVWLPTFLNFNQTSWSRQP